MFNSFNDAMATISDTYFSEMFLQKYNPTSKTTTLQLPYIYMLAHIHTSNKENTHRMDLLNYVTEDERVSQSIHKVKLQYI